VADEHPKDSDAHLRFGGSPDRMKVGVARYEPAQGRGRPLTLELMRETLREAGVAAPLDETAASDVVRLLLADPPRLDEARAMVIARGSRPEEPRDAKFTPAATPGLPVFPGQVVGRLSPAQLPHEGRDVAGEPVAPANPVPPREIHAGQGLDRGPDGTLSARTAGVLRLDIKDGAGVVRLDPFARIAADRLCASMDLPPKDALGNDIAPESVVMALSGQGVTFGIDLEAIVRGLAEARHAGKPVTDVVAARGQAPAHGENGRLELLCENCVPPEPPDENARIDYRERGPLPVAREGEDLARLLPPTKGSPGRDVFGKTAPARDGRPLRPRLGRGVEALPPDEHGVVLLRARTDGAVILGSSSLDVTELLQVPGDVDFTTGNLLLAKGSVRIGGTVRSGFHVEAPGAVIVEGMVESARVIAGGEVRVTGGVFMSGDEAAFVRAGGGFSANYTHNAHVEAAGDVAVRLAIIGSKVNRGSRVSSGGRLRVTDAKGRIMGGTVVCSEGLEVFQAGAESGLATTLAISHETPEAAALIQEMRELKALRLRALMVLGEGDGAAALARLTDDRRAEAEELLAKRETVESSLRRIQQALAQMARDHMERVSSARIVIHGVAHPGVAIKMGGASLYLDQAIERCAFSWDAKARQIVTGNL
jgi:uncharacterized protein (DUF342 family)